MRAVNEESIFAAALAEKTPSKRASFLDQACGGDALLRSRVEALLRAHDNPDSFLEAPQGQGLRTVDAPVREGPGTIVGQYKLLEEIGEGGFGIVFLAEQHKPMRRRVALKVLKPGMDTRQVIARFEAERQALALMDHPNIARVHDGGETATGRPYFVMELVKGTPLTDYCDQARLTPKQRLEVFVTVCQAVQHAHQKGIIHRDLKPSNVLVALHDGTPVVKVIDFGIAKATVAQLTEKTLFTGFAQMIGTPLYMSPEQAGQSSLDVDTRSDIYSLGVLLYELLTGTTPFDRERFKEAGFEEIRRIIREEEPPRPSTRISTLGRAATTVSEQRQSDPRKLSHLYRGELDWIVMKCLEKDRNHRYETASALAADVQRYLNDEPVQACPPRALYRFQKFARRNKKALFTVAGLFLAVVATLVGLWVDNARVEDALQHATRKEKETEDALNQVKKALGEKSQALSEKTQALGEKSVALRNEKHAMAAVGAARDRDWQLSYLRRIALARHEMQANNVDRANKILDECVPAQGQADPRHWEWHYLKRQCRGPLFTIPKTPFYGHRAVFSPRGRCLVMGTSSGVFSLDAATGRPRQDHAPLVPRVASPFGFSDPRPGDYGHVTYSPDGQCLAAAGLDRKREGHSVKGTPLVRVWHVATGQEIATLRGPGETNQKVEVITSVAFSPDSRLVATGSTLDGTVTLWDAATGRKVRSLAGHNPVARCVAFSPDGKTLASAGGTRDNNNPVPGEVELWDLATGQCRATLRGHTGGINSLAFSPGGLLASGSGDTTVRIWDPASARQLALLRGHTAYVLCVTFSPDGKYLASGSTDTTVMVWPMVGGTQQAFRGHTSGVTSVAFSPDSQRLASVDDQNHIKVWDMRTTPAEVTLRYPAELAGFSPDSRSLALASVGDLLLYDPTTGRGQYLFQGKGHFFLGNATSLAFTPDGKRLAAANTGRMRRWDLTTGKEAPALGGGPPGMFSPDGRLFASASSNAKDIKVCDADTGREVRVLRGHASVVLLALGGSFHGVSFSADGKRLASMAGQEVKVWDLDSGQALGTFRAPPATHNWARSATAYTRPAVALSRDGRLLAASGDQVQVWDLKTGREVHTLRGHTGLICHLAFSPDGRRLVSASRDGSVFLWDMATGQEAFSFRYGGWEFTCLAFSPDGRRLVLARRPADLGAMNEGMVTWYDANETNPEVKAAFREGQKVDRQLRTPVERKFGQVPSPFWSLPGLINGASRRASARSGVVDRARDHCGRAEWQAAAAAYAEVTRADPKASGKGVRPPGLKGSDPFSGAKGDPKAVAKADLMAALAHQYERAAALLLAGDAAGYRQACAAVLEHFAATTDPWTAYWVARLAVLGTNPAKARAQFVRLAERAVVAQPRNGPRLQFLAAAHYRAGQYEAALRRLQEAQRADWYGYPLAVNWLLSAQVHHALGQAPVARQWLDKAAAWIDQATQRTPREQAEALHLELADLMACRLLRREAQLLITGKADDPSPVLNETAWLLATCADPKRRDPARAVALARQAVARAPAEAAYRRTLGVALYRAGDWKASAAALENSVPLRDGAGPSDAPEGFFLAMAHWHLGDKGTAYQEYEATRQWMAKQVPKDEDLLRFREEAGALLGLIIRSFKGHTGAVSGLALSADASRALSCSLDRTVRLWNIESGKQLRCLPAHPALAEGGVSCLALTADGRHALSGSWDKTVRLWDVDKRREIRRFLGHTMPIRSVAFSPDGRLALSGGNDKTVRVWEVATGRELHCLTGHTNLIVCVAFSPDGRQVLSGVFKTLRLWDLRTGKEQRQFQFKGPTQGVGCLAFSADGRRILIGHWDNILRLWDVKTGQEIRGFQGHTGLIKCLAFSPDGRWAVSGSEDGTARVWDVETGKEVYSFDGHRGGVSAVMFTPDGNRVLSGSGAADGTILLWKPDWAGAHYRLADALAAEGKHAEAGRTAAALPRVAPRSWVQYRQAAGLLVRCVYLAENDHSLSQPQRQAAIRAYVRQGKELYQGISKRCPKDRNVLVGLALELAKGPDPRFRHLGEALALAQRAVQLAPNDGTCWLAAGLAHYRLGSWKAAQDALEKGMPLRNGGDCTDWFFMAMTHWQRGEKAKARQWYDKAARWMIDHDHDDWPALRAEAAALLGLAHLVPLRTIPYLKEGNWAVNVIDLAPSADGSRILAGGDSMDLRLYEAATGKELRRLTGHSHWVFAVALSPDGRRALSGGADKMLRLWDVKSGKQLRSFAGHATSICFVAFAADGRYALSGGFDADRDDRVIRLWDVEKGKEVRQLTGHTGRIHHAAFSPDGRRVLSASADRTIRLWDAKTGKQIRQFQDPGTAACVSFSPDGRTALSAGPDDPALRLWDVKTGKLLRRLEGFKDKKEPPNWVAFTPDGRRAVSAHHVEARLRLWDVMTGAELYCVRLQPGLRLNRLVVAPDGNWVASCNWRGSVSVWQLHAPRPEP
jgi:WD40 repeat protein/serine/threonine protein kinase